jgi:YgiT-type zinc finger domain-containing protein
MECPICGGDLQPGVAPHSVNRHGYHLTFDDVPAMICDQCHTPLHNLEVVELIGQALDAVDDIQRKLAAVKYNLPEAEPHHA